MRPRPWFWLRLEKARFIYISRVTPRVSEHGSSWGVPPEVLVLAGFILGGMPPEVLVLAGGAIDDLENSILRGINVCISLTRPLFTSRHHERRLVHEI